MDISPELVERMVALVRQLADCPVEGQRLFDVDAEALAIAVQLPEPVDPDLIEARRIATEFSRRDGGLGLDYTLGRNDDGSGISAVLAAIKRGRELERQNGGSQ